MPLTAGTRFGHFEITAPLGMGGMGEMYRARDGRLDRDVAIKVVPPALAQDSQYLTRFEREAKWLASLNHPNIAIVYAIEQGALIMELVEGPTLEDRIAQRRRVRFGQGFFNRGRNPGRDGARSGGSVAPAVDIERR